MEQIADASQVRAIGQLLAGLAKSGDTLDQPPEAIARRLLEGPAALSHRPDGDLALPRVFEVMAALNRLRQNGFGRS